MPTTVSSTHARALRFDGHDLVLVDHDLPPPPAGTVRVRSEWTQVSIGTETAWIREHAATGTAVELGYANVGIIAELGPGVTGWEIGQRVLSSAPHASAANVPAQELLVVPAGLAPDRAAAAVLGSIAFHIVQRAAPRVLEAAAVIGQGVVGSLTLQLLRGCGVEPLIAIDADRSRLAFARDLGAETVDCATGDAIERVRSLTGGAGVALCVEAANTAEAFPTALAILALRGRLIATSTIHRPVPIRVLDDVIERELSIIGAHQPKCPTSPNPYHPWTQAGNRLAAMRAIRDGRLHTDHLVSHRVPAEAAIGLYERLLAGDRTIVGALIDWRD